MAAVGRFEVLKDDPLSAPTLGLEAWETNPPTSLSALTEGPQGGPELFEPRLERAHNHVISPGRNLVLDLGPFRAEGVVGPGDADSPFGGALIEAFLD